MNELHRRGSSIWLVPQWYDKKSKMLLSPVYSRVVPLISAHFFTSATDSLWSYGFLGHVKSVLCFSNQLNSVLKLLIHLEPCQLYSEGDVLWCFCVQPPCTMDYVYTDSKIRMLVIHSLGLHSLSNPIIRSRCKKPFLLKWCYRERFDLWFFFFSDKLKPVARFF